MKYKRKKDKDFWVMARAYLHEYMPAVRNRSDKTVTSYKESLKTYLFFLKEEKNLVDDQVTFDAFSRSNIKDYVKWMKQKPYAEKTINLKLTAVRSFLKYCSEEDFELKGVYNEVCTIKNVKTEKKPIEYLQPEATKAVLSAYDTSTSKHRRNRTILILLYDTGARVQEIVDLSVSSLHLKETNPFITIVGKGHKRRNVPLMKKTVAYLEKYLDEFHPDRSDNPLFYSLHDGKPDKLSTDTISLILKKAADKARLQCPDVPTNIHCHMIRKTRAMDLYRSGMPLPFIMQFLGHESMSTTSGFYAFATLEMMSDAMKKAAPSFTAEEKIWKKPELKKMLYSLD